MHNSLIRATTRLSGSVRAAHLFFTRPTLAGSLPQSLALLKHLAWMPSDKNSRPGELIHWLA
jgi:hypothetical protein